MPRRVACLLLLHLMHIACDGVVGSPRVRDACGVCGGSNATCQIISGIFTEPYLEAGYRLVAQIPAGACSIHIQEMGITDNYLALRDIHSRFILNGDWNIDNSGTYKGAGASFGYQRQTERTGERISALGPIAEPVDIVILYRQANRGIKYEYAIKRNNSLSSVLPRLPSATGVAQVPRPTLADQQRQPAPSAVAPPPPPPRARGGAGFVSSLYQPAQRPVRPGRTRPRPGGPSAAGAGARAGARRRRRRRRNRFQWVVTGFSACSRSCGGGTQIAEVVCMRRKRKQLARNRKCDPRRRPKPKATPCNTFPCPVSSWEPNPWSACSSTCGTGHQTRTFLCVRAGQPVEVTECEGRPTEPEVQECDAGPCPANARWQIGQWSPCSVSCDWGSRTRRVSCAEPGRCPATERPRDTAPCRLQPCPQQVHSDHRPAGWMTTDWTDQCSVECGQGVQWRGVTCGGDVGRCQPGSRPQQTRPCKTDRGCGGIWFTGPWSQCSHECGDGGQATRTVLCIRRTDAEFAVAAERACAATARPPDRQPCGGGAGCPPRWFVTEWAACSATCGIGRQRRTVACVDADGELERETPATNQPEEQLPTNELESELLETNELDGEPRFTFELDEKPPSANGLRGAPFPGQAPAENTLVTDDSCTDKFSYCSLVQQARLCKYKYYKNSCCAACRGAR
ncbi:thrombospondin type-1 domain-containing protein 4-like [Pollicipes pollicipes]|uniref:thrombospondin type-1 domain-containing protein 4-like n=1 Tax=Pollicipes pollicipes TaxID=41117 RepID=UPI0018857C49|nr:thrombospondin type-1 domain-containing protein 4-like [Pollicipes pollicipes]